MATPDIERLIAERPLLIVPLGALEPLGREASVGAVNTCTAALAHGISRDLQVACAPLLPYGCSVPFMAFGGIAGVKPKRMARFLSDVIRCWAFQGVRATVLLDGASMGDRIDLPIRRYFSAGGPAVLHLQWQQTAELRDKVRRECPGTEYGRSEYAVLSIAAHLGAVSRREGTPPRAALPAEKLYRTWRKRGGDPEKYRRLFPDGSSSEIACRFDPGVGSRLFETVRNSLSSSVVRFFEAHHA